MNLLTDALPDRLTVGGRAVPIKTDFRNWIRLSQALIGAESDEAAEAAVASVLEDPADILTMTPDELRELVVAETDFLTCGDTKTESDAAQKRLFDYDFDGDEIYSSFLMQYKADLSSEKMHWWKFRALFGGLNTDTPIMRRITARSTNVSDVDPGHQRDFEKYKRSIELPKTAEEKEVMDEIDALFYGAN